MALVVGVRRIGEEEVRVRVRSEHAPAAAEPGGAAAAGAGVRVVAVAIAAMRMVAKRIRILYLEGGMGWVYLMGRHREGDEDRLCIYVFLDLTIGHTMRMSYPLGLLCAFEIKLHQPIEASKL